MSGIFLSRAWVVFGNGTLPEEGSSALIIGSV
jgi:hypothetical protein